jgi:hypothetical protein
MKTKIKSKSKGFGDTIARFTHFFMLDKFAMWFATKILKKEDCGCERRRDKLNNLFPYKNNKVYDTKALYDRGLFGDSQRDDTPHSES